MIGKLISLYLICAFATPVHAQEVYDIKNMPVLLGDGYYILKNDKNCLKCFEEVFLFIKNRDDKFLIQIISLIDSSVFARKREQGNINNLVPQIDKIMFSYKNSAGRSLFDRYGIDMTPALLVIKGKRLIAYKYNDIYNGALINEAFMSEKE